MLYKIPKTDIEKRAVDLIGYSLRNMSECLEHNRSIGFEGSGYSGFNQYEFIARNGFFATFDRDGESLSLTAGEPKLCYTNTYRVCSGEYHATGNSGSYIYMEGYVVLADLPIPIEHAWVYSVEDGCILETTLHGRRIMNGKAFPEAAYFGVPASFGKFCREVVSVTGIYGLFNHASHKVFSASTRPLDSCIIKSDSAFIEDSDSDGPIWSIFTLPARYAHRKEVKDLSEYVL